MAKCLRCNAGNEWIEGNPRRAPRDGVELTLTALQAKFLRSLLVTHGLVCVPTTAARCEAIKKKLDAASDVRCATTTKETK